LIKLNPSINKEWILNAYLYVIKPKTRLARSYL